MAITLHLECRVFCTTLCPGGIRCCASGCALSGLSQAAAGRITAARRAGAFVGVADLARRARLNRADLKSLPPPMPCRGLIGHRHLAAWEVAGVEDAVPLYGLDRFAEQLPLLAALEHPGRRCWPIMRSSA